MDYPLRRALISAPPYTDLGNGTICINNDVCFCEDWYVSKGTQGEKVAAVALQWATFGICIACLLWYAYEAWRSTVGWEEVYVATIEMVKFIIEAFHEFDSPAMLYLSTGVQVVWLRYAEWLLTCPVILIHLSNLTGLKDDYNKRTMGLLVSDVGCIVWGASAAMSTSWVRIVFFLLALCYGMYTYFHAAKVYIESYHTVPKGICRDLVRILAWVYFLSWGMFPILFVLGPEGFGHISQYASAIAHAILDLISKNLWGLLGHFLRVKIHEHILLYGDIRKKTKINVAGQEMEVETMVVEEDEETVKQPTAKYASRESFIVMRNRLRDKGFEVRASLDGDTGLVDGGDGGESGTGAGGAGGGGGGGKGKGGATEMGKMGGIAAAATAAASSAPGVGFAGGNAGATLEPGRVILAVPDISMLDFFREQFSMLPVPYEVVPALGVENTIQLVHQASTLGGCDFVLMHPEFLRDRSPNGLLNKLKMLGQRTAAFGWAPMGPMRDLIEASGVDAWLEGPSFGSGINQAGLTMLVSRMQQARRMSGGGAGGMGVGGGMMGGMGNGGMGNGMNNGMGGMGNGGMGNGGMGNGGMGNGGMGNGMNNGMGTASMNNGMMSNAMNNGMGTASMNNGMMSNAMNNGMATASMNNGMMSNGVLTGMGAASMNNGSVGNVNNGMMSGPSGGMSGLQHSMSMVQPQQQQVAPPSPEYSRLASMQQVGSTRIGTNPLYNSTPSPLNSQPGIVPGTSGLGTVASGGLSGIGAPPPPMASPAANASEAEMLSQLMNEINRLKNELGE